MSGLKRIGIVFAIVIPMLLLGIQITHAAVSCADGNIDACWARFYVAGNGDGTEDMVFFRIYQACPDGVRIGIASNTADEYEFYVKQYGSDQNPQFRLLTEPTTVHLNHYPLGTSIEYTSEIASAYQGMVTVYYVRVFNVGWSETFDDDYDDQIILASTGYGYDEDTSLGAVRFREFDNCYSYHSPFDTLVNPSVQCVMPGPNGSLTAVFGYDNQTHYDSIIPNGPYNSVRRTGSSSPPLTSPPTFFAPGIHDNAFRITGTGQGFNWTLEGASATATVLSPRC
jgi:hypothetical protein